VHAERGWAWMERQLRDPQTLYSVSELADLSGLDKQRVRRFLTKKELIEKGGPQEVAFGDIVDRIPGFWKTIESRIARMRAQNVEAAA
jgi:hypothetical protein